MRYAFEVLSDGTKTIHAFVDEATRAKWIAASPSPRGVLSGNSREGKSAPYRGVFVLAGHPKLDAVTHTMETQQSIQQDREKF